MAVKLRSWVANRAFIAIGFDADRDYRLLSFLLHLN